MIKKVFILDDFKDARDCLISIIKENFSSSLRIVGEADNIQDAAKGIKEKEPDMLFLDIEIGRDLVFSLFEHISPSNYDIVFITGHSDYAIKAFEFNAIDYILKPVGQESIAEMLEKRTSQQTRYTQDFFNAFSKDFINRQTPKQLGISTESEIIFVDIDQISYIQAERSYCKILTNKGLYTATNALSHYENLLPDDQFFRGHKSFLINLNKVNGCQKRDNMIIAQLDENTEISIARRRKAEFIQALEKRGLIFD